MRIILVNIIIFLAVFAACYFNIFDWFTTKYAFWFALVLVLAMLGLAAKILGTPLGRGDNNENK